MWRKFLLAAVVAAVLAPASTLVTVEPESADVYVRECDDLVLNLTTSGTYTKPYQVTVVCVGKGGADSADFANKTAMKTVMVTMDQPTIEMPLPLNDDNVVEQDEVFRCFFFTSGAAGVRRGRVTLTVTDNDLICPLGQTSDCGLMPPPNCNNPNPTQTEGVGCLCPDGMLIKADGTCVLPANCVDCPADQAARFSKSPGPTCDDPNPAEEATKTFKCFCPNGTLIKDDGSCVLLVDCIDCPAEQTPRLSKAPAPTCGDQMPPEEPNAKIRCFCPDGKVIKDDICVIPIDCGSITGQASGDPHYRTYDGLFYDLFDHCSHIFTKDCADETFTVISITSNQCSGGGAPTCIERAVIQVPGLNTEVHLTGQPLQFSIVGDTPPNTDLSIVSTNVITVSIFKLGVVVNFGLYYLAVTVPGSYFGKMCGLLGNYDGNPGNDYQLPNGTVVNEPTPEFEMAYRTDHPNDDCDHMDPQPAPLCEGTALQQAEAFCDVLRQPGGPFSACHGTISPDQAFADCVLDHCVCDTELCRCTVILNYAERCQALGITVGPIPTPCVPTCPDGLVYSICSPNLPPTCADQAGQFDPCRPGCACPAGKVLKDTNVPQCVDPFLCEGKLEIPESDPKFRTCNAWGDPHYTTFDGLVHHFQGVCYYNFACDCEESLFHVYSKQERCYSGRVTCTTEVIIEVKGYAGRIEIGRNGAFSPDIATLPANIFQVMRAGNAYTVNILPLKTTVYYDGYWTINVEIPDTFFGRVCGLCGNANEDPNDDFQALVNGSLQLVTDLATFGLSWANFKLSEEIGCEVAYAIPGPCEGSKRRRAEQFCKKLRTKGITSGCIDTINPLEYISSCIFDYCASETAPGVVDDLSSVCSHFVQYCSKCTEVLGKPTDLPAECLPQCAEGEDYKTCGPVQEGTCTDPLPIMQPGTCTPGCSCMEGFVRHEGKCIKFTDCPVIVNFRCKSFSVKEGDGICLPIKASGALNRDFDVTVNFGKQFAADDSGAAPCSCKSPGDAQVCGGSDSCTVSFSTGDDSACVYIKMDGDDILEEDRTETLTLTAGDGIIIGDPGEVTLLVIDDDFNALTFEVTSYYYTESKLADNNHVQLSEAPDAPVFAELQLEGGDGDTAAAAGLDFQSGVIQPYFDQGQSALFYVLVFNEKLPENAECFYMTLHSPKNGDSYNPEIRAWTPSKAIGWIESTKNKLPPTAGRDGLVCFDTTVPSQDVCQNDIVALVTFESEIDSKDCRLGWKATVRAVIKGGDLVPQTEVSIFVLPVMGCNVINFKRGEHYLVAGSLDTAGGIGVFVHDVSVARKGEVIWDSNTFAPVLNEIMRCASG